MKTVWVMPNSLIQKNVDEIVRFTPFAREDVAFLQGDGPKRRKNIVQQEKPVLLMGPDAFKLTYDLLPMSYRALDVDEFQMCFAGKAYDQYGYGNYTMSARATAFCRAFPRMKEAVLMSGTMINSGRLETAYPAIHAIEPGYYPMGINDFMAHHARYDIWGKLEGWVNHDRIAKIFGRHGVRFTFESIFGEQEIVRQTRWVDMMLPQREIYDQFAEQAYLELEDFIVNGTLPGVATIRARQIMEHPNLFPDLRFDNSQTVDILPGHLPAKIHALDEEVALARELGKPLIIFASMTAQMRQLAERYDAFLLSGSVNSDDRPEIDRAFREKGGVLVASPMVSSVGYNWQHVGGTEVETIIFASLSFYDTHFIQGYRRAVRGERTKPLRVVTLAYKDSLDQRIMLALERKSREAHLVDSSQELLRFDDNLENSA